MLGRLLRDLDFALLWALLCEQTRRLVLGNLRRRVAALPAPQRIWLRERAPAIVIGG